MSLSRRRFLQGGAALSVLPLLKLPFLESSRAPVKETSTQEASAQVILPTTPPGTLLYRMEHGKMCLCLFDGYAWVEPDGRTLCRNKYPALYANIGTTYGAPSSTQFSIPDYRGRAIDRGNHDFSRV